MDDAARVRASQSPGDFSRDAQRILDRQRPARDPPIERFAVVAGHHDVQLTACGLADFVHRADVGMLQRGRRARLRKEAPLRLRIGAQMGRQELQGHIALQALIARAVHDAHAATTKALEHAVACIGRHGGHRIQSRALRQVQRRHDVVEQRIEGAPRVVRRQQRRDIGPNRFRQRHGREVARPRLLGLTQHLVERRFNLRPPLRRRPVRHVVSSRFNHARAAIQSRFTVAGESCSASAVSSMLSPTKNRHSTTLA